MPLQSILPFAPRTALPSSPLRKGSTQVRAPRHAGRGPQPLRALPALTPRSRLRAEAARRIPSALQVLGAIQKLGRGRLGGRSGQSRQERHAESRPEKGRGSGWAEIAGGTPRKAHRHAGSPAGRPAEPSRAAPTLVTPGPTHPLTVLTPYQLPSERNSSASVP